jgi:xanthine dehydrogenase large subunit
MSASTIGPDRGDPDRPRRALRRHADLSPAINDRAMFHADNCYYLPAVEIVSKRLRTHTVSNTAFRGFGGPQGMIAIERVMDAIAAALGLDPLAVRGSPISTAPAATSRPTT